MIEWHERIFWWREDGGTDLMAPNGLPAPLHTALSFMRMKLLTRQQKKEVRRAMLLMLRGGHRLRVKYDGLSFGDFLHSTNQSSETIRLFWDTVIVSACNLPSSQTAAVHGMQVFQEAFLPGRWAGTMGLSTVPLAELYDPAEKILADSGGQLQLGCSVREICLEGRKAVGVMTGDSMERADAVISTVPPDRLARLLPVSIRSTDRRLQHLESFEFSPILGVHVHWPEPVMDLPHLVLAGQPVHWIFNKGVDESGRQHLHMVISAADDWMGLDEESILRSVRLVTDKASEERAHLTPCSVRAVKEKRATFSATADIEAIARRPDQAQWESRAGMSNHSTWRGTGATRDGPRPWRAPSGAAIWRHPPSQATSPGSRRSRRDDSLTCSAWIAEGQIRLKERIGVRRLVDSHRCRLARSVTSRTFHSDENGSSPTCACCKAAANLNECPGTTRSSVSAVVTIVGG